MRRKDREVTDREQILEVIGRCDCCRLGFADGEDAYLVPLNFGYVQDGQGLHLYFHGAREGRKADLIRRKGRAGFEMDTNHQVNRNENPCEYSFRFQSVIGRGTIGPVEDPEQKAAALNLIMSRYSPRGDWEFPSHALANTAVFRLDVEELSCKEHH